MYRRNVFLTALLTAALLLPARAQQPPANAKQQQAPAPAQPPNQQAPEQSGQTFKREVNLVDVLFTVLNRRNKLVPDLDEKDFKVLDDGKPQEIRYFSKQTDLPLRIGMLLDTSNSIRDRIKFEQDASVNFLFSVLRRNKDEAFVMTFDDEPQIIQPFTSDTGALRDQIMSTRAGGGTAIYDAIYEACAKQLNHPPRPPGDQPDVVQLFRSEEHTSELQSQSNLVCRLLLEKKNQKLIDAIQQAHAYVCFIVFYTLTLSADLLESFYDNHNALRDYFLDIVRSVFLASCRTTN